MDSGTRNGGRNAKLLMSLNGFGWLLIRDYAVVQIGRNWLMSDILRTQVLLFLERMYFSYLK